MEMPMICNFSLVTLKNFLKNVNNGQNYVYVVEEWPFTKNNSYLILKGDLKDFLLNFMKKRVMFHPLTQAFICDTQKTIAQWLDWYEPKWPFKRFFFLQGTKLPWNVRENKTSKKLQKKKYSILVYFFTMLALVS